MCVYSADDIQSYQMIDFYMDKILLLKLLGQYPSALPQAGFIVLAFTPLGIKKVHMLMDMSVKMWQLAYRKENLHNLYSTHNPAPPCSDEQAPIPAPDAETRKKIVAIFHDESIFHINESQTWAWGNEDRPYIQPKTKGAGIMVSDFIEQHGGYLRLSDQQHDLAKMNDSNFPKLPEF